VDLIVNFISPDGIPLIAKENIGHGANLRDERFIQEKP
jgi:hypothetical protein